MNPAIAALLCFVAYLLGYHLYAKYLAGRVFQLDP